MERSQLGLLGTQDGVAVARGTLADGTAWALRADRGGSLDLRVADDGADGDSVSSSFNSSPDRLRASIVTETGGRRILAGLVDPEVAAIEVRTAGGDRLNGVPTHRVELDEASAAEAGDELTASSWFVVELTEGADQLVLLDDRGDVLQRHEVRGSGVNPEASATTVPGG